MIFSSTLVRNLHFGVESDSEDIFIFHPIGAESNFEDIFLQLTQNLNLLFCAESKSILIL